MACVQRRARVPSRHVTWVRTVYLGVLAEPLADLPFGTWEDKDLSGWTIEVQYDEHAIHRE